MDLTCAIYIPTWNSGTILALLAVAFVVFLYGVAPLLVKKSQYHQAERDLQPTTLEDMNFTAREGMRRAVHDLGAEGFEVLSNHTTKGAVPGSHSVAALFVNRPAGDFAEGFFVSSQQGDAYTESWTVVIRTRFADDTQITTACSPSPTAFPVDPKSDSINPYWIKDGRLLYAIHRARVERSGRAGEPRVLPQPGQVEEFLRAEHRRELRRVTEAGYYWLDEPAGKYRLTFKGAYLMTWRLLWPLKPLRAAARRRKTRKELHRLGFTEAATAPAPAI